MKFFRSPCRIQTPSTVGQLVVREVVQMAEQKALIVDKSLVHCCAITKNVVAS